MSILLQGTPASPGTVIGPIWRYRPVEVVLDESGDHDPVGQWQRCEKALADARRQLSALKEHAGSMMSDEEAQIFDVQLVMLDDPEWQRSIREVLDRERTQAEAAVQKTTRLFAEGLQALDDDYLKERAQDILDAGRRLVLCLQGINPDEVLRPSEPAIILAEDLMPSDTIRLGRDLVLGFATTRGSPSSHVAILARGLNVPAVVNVQLQLESYQDGQLAILDGDVGTLHIDPDAASLVRARKTGRLRGAQWADQVAASQRSAVTVDGHRVAVMANIGGVEDALQAITFGAEGVGLLRTEFLYMDRLTLPSLREQVQAYRRIAGVIGDRPVVARTLDIGGDKAVPYLGLRSESNPFLGWRAIRLMPEKPSVLRDQFEALLQGFVSSDLRILLPMVSNLEEVLQARHLLEEARNRLRLADGPAAENVELGVMVEVPSVALLANHFAAHVDFFSIGTNDLTQYVLAVDRTNERVAHLASPFHPAVIRLIAQTIEQAHAYGKWVGLCGEMAGNPLAIPLLIGLGLDELSMAPVFIPAAKERIRQLSHQECRKAASYALTLPTTMAVVEFLSELA